MVLHMPSPTKRNGSDNWYFRRRLPNEVKAIVAAMPKEQRPNGWSTHEVWISLGTPDRDKAKALYSEVAISVDQQIAALLMGPQPLTQKQIIALAGVAYREMLGMVDDEPGAPEAWGQVLRLHGQAREADKLEQWVGPTADSILQREGILADEASRARLIEEADRSLVQAAERLKRQAEGDYAPDPAAQRFPEWAPSQPVLSPVNTRTTPSATSGATSFQALLDGWAAAKNPRQQTVDSYTAAIREFEAFLGHDDAAKVVPRDVINWIEHLEAQGKLSASTINNKRLAALNTVLNWSVRKLRLPTNAAQGARSEGKAPPRTRQRAFTSTEAKTLLRAALGAPKHPGKTSIEMIAAQRWVPWICAYTGARVAEITQLRGKDFQEQEGIWLLQITPDAGAVKNNNSRIVPIHPHLIELGLKEYVEERGAKPLFYSEARLKKADGKTHPSKTVAGRLTQWVRSVGIDDPDVQPNHAWRHLFMTLCRDHDVKDEAHYHIVGHAKRDQGQAYGHYSPTYLLRELSKIPAFIV